MKGFAMLYRPSPVGATAPELSGRNLAHTCRTIPERASLVGADLHHNRITLVSPTLRQCAYLADVCGPYVRTAISIIDDLDARDAILRGDINILDTAKRSNAHEPLDHIQRSSAEELAAAARATGIDLIWDSMLQPNPA
jgi:hypothetical protein